jgi:hypothetical protein
VQRRASLSRRLSTKKDMKIKATGVEAARACVKSFLMNLLTEVVMAVLTGIYLSGVIVDLALDELYCDDPSRHADPTRAVNAGADLLWLVLFTGPTASGSTRSTLCCSNGTLASLGSSRSRSCCVSSSPAAVASSADASTSSTSSSSSPASSL